MAKTQTETFIRRSVVDALRRAGWFVIYNMQMGFGQHRGLADLTCMKAGRVIFVEIKTAVGKQSPDQVQFQKDCEAHGVTYILARLNKKRMEEKGMEYKIYDEKILKEKLETMTGNDFAKAEKAARLEGDVSIDIMTSRMFYAAVAARAFNKPLPDILELPLKEFAAITGDVGSFLLAPDAVKVESSTSSGNLP